MTHRLESRLAKLERQAQAATGGITITVVEDKDWYANDAHRLASEAKRDANDQTAWWPDAQTP